MPRPPKSQWSSTRARASRTFARRAKALGLRMRALREAKDWTLEQAADAMEMDLTHVQKIEAGSLNPTLVTLWRIADGLGVGVEALFRK